MDQDKFNQLIDLAISIQNNARLSGGYIRPEDAMKQAKAWMGIPEPTDGVKPPAKPAT
jgi:hypothetical protein